MQEGDDPPRKPISLAGMYPGGLLKEGRIVQKTDDVVVCEPHLVTLDEMRLHLGGTTDRDMLLEHLTGFHHWFAEATRRDARAELWVRGNLASTLSGQVEELDLVAFFGPHVSTGSEWLLRRLLASPARLPPYSLVVTPLPHDAGEHAFDRAREARRSRVRARDQDKEPLETGWLSVTLRGGEA